jgi:hypothetical protein
MPNNGALRNSSEKINVNKVRKYYIKRKVRKVMRTFLN